MDVHVRQPGHDALPFRVNDLRVARDCSLGRRSCIFDLAPSENYRVIFRRWPADSINNPRANDRDGLFLCRQPLKRTHDDHPQRQQRATPIHNTFSWTIRMSVLIRNVGATARLIIYNPRGETSVEKLQWKN